MKRFWLLVPLLFLCVIPSHAAITIVNHTYIPAATGCSNGTPHLTCTFSITITNTGDTELVWYSTCFKTDCSSAGATTASDGTNKWQKVVPGDYENASGLWSVQPWIASNATAGSYTLTFTLNTFNSSTDFYYSRAEVVELSGVSTIAPIDYYGCANKTASSAAPTLTSQGNIAASGELSMALFNANGTPSNTGAYTTLDSNSADGALILYTTPSSGATTTAAITSGNGVYYSSMITFQTTAPLSSSPSPGTVQF